MSEENPSNCLLEFIVLTCLEVDLFDFLFFWII